MIRIFYIDFQICIHHHAGEVSLFDIADLGTYHVMRETIPKLCGCGNIAGIRDGQEPLSPTAGDFVRRACYILFWNLLSFVFLFLSLSGLLYLSPRGYPISYPCKLAKQISEISQQLMSVWAYRVDYIKQLLYKHEDVSWGSSKPM